GNLRDGQARFEEGRGFGEIAEILAPQRDPPIYGLCAPGPRPDILPVHMNSETRKSGHGYDFQSIESKWRDYWEAHKTFRAPGPGDPGFDPKKPKSYVLDMFPYPSGRGLHVGHPLGYIASDIVSRFRRMLGYNVLHPMGYDAFGLPAEQYAIETGTHPRVTTEANIVTFRRQLKALALSYDWDREIATIEPEYYRWTQWIF